MAIARRPVDGDARGHELCADRINILHGIGEVTEIAPAGMSSFSSQL